MMLKIFNKNKYNKGVTLIELLVVISIIAILTVVTLADYNKYRSSMPTQNLADDIALSVRKAQGYAIGVKGDSSGFNYGYGIHISTGTNISNPSAGSNKAFIIFKDMNDDGKYTKDSSTTCGTPSLQNECLEILTINSLDRVATINNVKSSGESAGGGDIDIRFKRPYPEPTFCYKTTQFGLTCQLGSDSILATEIIVGNGSGNGHPRTIVIWKNGQISID